ncbi:hypothetical protein RhiLY_02622 [Ceratobasidium sp. AG-Ba]|nr:hypothetical protein RhiLY_02622 [Ceratobasidium sp. AG-Ba]
MSILGDVPGPTSLPVKPADSTVSTAPRAAVHSSSRPSVGSNSNASRSTLAMERQMNEMNDGLQDLKRTSEQRQMATDSTLAQILNAIQRLESASTPSPTGFTSSTPPDEKHDLSGLGVTTGLAMMASRVVSGSRSREHTRTTLYGLAKIKSANHVQPYYEDEYGQPDTLPEAYFDRATGQGRVFPHWKAPLNKQLAWLPYYLRRFKATIPHDNSELSEALRALWDEEILVLLNNGAFKTCCAAWHTITLNKTKDEIEAMKSNARRYQRTKRKATSRGGHIKAKIPSVQGPGWECLSHPKYMSQDESDDEGILTTKRPEYHAKWITNLFEAMDVLERERPRPKHQALARRVEMVKRPIPHLEHGLGSSKVTIRIPMCGISKSWHNDNPDEFQRHGHLIDINRTEKPDITAFLEKYPAGWDGGSVLDDNSKVEDVGTGLEDGWTYVEGVNFGVGAGNCEIDYSKDWEGLDYDGDEESGAVLEMGNRTALTGLPNGYSKDNIPIDPEILALDAAGNGTHSGTPDTESVLPSPVKGAPPVVTSVYDSGMPPPPPLEPHLNISQHQDHPVDATSGSSKPAKLTKQGMASSNNTADVQVANPPKRCGRPPGSKNKPKVKQPQSTFLNHCARHYALSLVLRTLNNAKTAYQDSQGRWRNTAGRYISADNASRLQQQQPTPDPLVSPAPEPRSYIPALAASSPPSLSSLVVSLDTSPAPSSIVFPPSPAIDPRPDLEPEPGYTSPYTPRRPRTWHSSLPSAPRPPRFAPGSSDEDEDEDEPAVEQPSPTVVLRNRAPLRAPDFGPAPASAQPFISPTGTQAPPSLGSAATSAMVGSSTALQDAIAAVRELKRFNGKGQPISKAEYRFYFLQATQGLADEEIARLWVNNIEYKSPAHVWLDTLRNDPNRKDKAEKWSTLQPEIEKHWPSPPLDFDAQRDAYWRDWDEHRLDLQKLKEEIESGKAGTRPLQAWAEEHKARARNVNSTDEDRVSKTIRVDLYDGWLVNLLPKRDGYYDKFDELMKDIGSISLRSLISGWEQESVISSMRSISVSAEPSLHTPPSYSRSSWRSPNTSWQPLAPPQTPARSAMLRRQNAPSRGVSFSPLVQVSHPDSTPLPPTRPLPQAPVVRDGPPHMPVPPVPPATPQTPSVSQPLFLRVFTFCSGYDGVGVGS